jgi:hypothetical protein
MRERDLDEFSSLFQRSIIPTIEVARIEIRDIVVIVDFDERSRAGGAIAADLAKRFGARVSVRFLLHPDDEAHAEAARGILDSLPGDERRLVLGDPVAHVHELTEKEKPSLIVSPAPFCLRGKCPEAIGEFINTLLVSTAIPTLLVRGPPCGPRFDRILAQIPGGRHDLIEQFSFAFALCPPGGLIRLLHVVDQERLAVLAELLEITPEIDTEQGAEELLEAIQTRMDHLIKGAVRTAKDAAFEVEGRVRVGDPFQIVPGEAEGFSLLILGSHASHGEFLESRAYELMRRIPAIALLAL